MGESDSPDTRPAVPTNIDNLQGLTPEGLQDNKSRIIAQLKRVSRVVSEANREQAQRESNPFTVKVNDLGKLGNGYIMWLDTNRDKVPDDKTFQAIASLAKTSLLLNLEQYVRTIREIGEYVKSQPELDALNPPGKKDGPWVGIKEVLYYTSFNDAREQFREGVLQGARSLIAAGELNPRLLDHIERFLVDPQKRLPHQFIAEYVARHVTDLQQWVPLTLENFKAYVATRLGNINGDLSENTFLKQMDEEIASIKPDNLQAVNVTRRTKYMDRQAKLAFIRDLRFGRENIGNVNREIALKVGEITNIPTLAGDLAPKLRQHWKGFQEELKATIGQESQTRKEALSGIVSSYGLSQQDLEFILDYLKNKIR